MFSAVTPQFVEADVVASVARAPMAKVVTAVNATSQLTAANLATGVFIVLLVSRS